MRAITIKALIAIFFLSFGALFLFRYWQEQIRERRALDFTIARIHHEEGRNEEAVKEFSKIIESRPESKEAIISLYYTGISLAQLGDNDGAIYYFQRLKNRFPASDYLPSAIYRWGQIEEEEGNLEKSLRLYENIKRGFPDSTLYSNALVGTGRINKTKGRWEDARGYFQEAINNFPQAQASIQAKKKLGRININLLTSPTMTEHCIVYKVAPMDTLGAIATKFNTTVELIMKRNNMKSPTIHPLQRIRILNGNFHIEADISENTLILYFNKEFVISYPIATGALNTPTPLGEFIIINRLIEPEWRGFPYNHPRNILGTRWMGINKPGFGIHGTTIPESIGTHATLGCIRMLNEDVEELFDLVPAGTVVRITK